jgi:flagellar motor switch protein FliN
MSTDYTHLLEIADHAIATGAKDLSQLLGVDVEFAMPSNLDHEPDAGVVGGNLVVVEMSFTAGIEGAMTLAFTGEGATQMVELMPTGTEAADEDVFGAHGMSMLAEAMTRFVAGIGRALGERKGCRVGFGEPRLEIVNGDRRLVRQPSDIVVAWDGTIGQTAGRLYWTMNEDVVHALAPELDASGRPTSPPAAVTGTATSAAGPAELGRLADVVLDVTVELGRSRIAIKELLALDEGGVIKLGRTVGEPVDLLVNGLATARGEIVVVDGRLGLRVTELIG